MFEIDLEADIKTASGIRGITRTVLSPFVPREGDALFLGDESRFGDWKVDGVEWSLDEKNCLRATLYLGTFEHEFAELIATGWTERKL